MLRNDIENKVLNKLINETFNDFANRNKMLYSSASAVCIGLPILIIAGTSPVTVTAVALGSVGIGYFVSRKLVLRKLLIKCKSKSWRTWFKSEFEHRMLIELNKERMSKSIYDGRYAIPNEELEKLKSKVLNKMMDR